MTVLETWQDPTPVKLTVEDFLHLADFGAFRDYAKVELIEGVIVAVNAQYSLHARIKSRLFRRIADAVDLTLPGHEAWSEGAIAIGPDTMPEPDILVTNFQPQERAAVPVETVAVVIEVADTTLRYDLGKKAALYARHGIPEYWVADVTGRVIHQMWTPASETYAERREVAFGERIAAMTIEGLAVETAGL